MMIQYLLCNKPWWFFAIGNPPWRRAPVPSKSHRENWAMSFRKGSKFWIWLGRWYEVWVKTCQAANLKKFVCQTMMIMMVVDGGWWMMDDGRLMMDDGWRWWSKSMILSKPAARWVVVKPKMLISHFPAVAWNVTFPYTNSHSASHHPCCWLLVKGLQIKAVGLERYWTSLLLYMLGDYLIGYSTQSGLKSLNSAEVSALSLLQNVPCRPHEVQWLPTFPQLPFQW